MPAGCHEAFQVYPGIAECGVRLGRRQLESLRELRRLANVLHSTTAASGHGLDQHRPADSAGHLRGLGHGGGQTAGDDRESGADGVPAGFEFVSDRR